jgi:hypothetical protein
MSKKDKLIQMLDHARSVMQPLLEEIDLNRNIYPMWTVRELVAHISGWDDAVIQSLKAHVDGREPGTPAALGINYYNEQTVSTRDGLDYNHIYREYVQTREILKDAIRNLPDHKLEEAFIVPWGPIGTIEQIVQTFSEHEEEHAADLKKLIEEHSAK